MFKEKKSTGTIKGRIRADDSTQRSQEDRLYATSLTVFQVSVMILS